MNLLKLSVQNRVLSLAALFLIASTVLVSVLALGLFERQFGPAMDKKAQVVGHSLNQLLGKMLDYGVPLDRLQGLDEVFAAVQRDNPDIAYLAVQDAEGKILYERWRPLPEDGARPIGTDELSLSSQPLRMDGQTVGSLKVGSDLTFMQRKMDEIVSDILTVLVVSGLMAIEVLVFLTTFMVSAPLTSIRQAMARVREGDLTQVIDHQSGDEVGRLSAYLNRAIIRLNSLLEPLKPSALTARFRSVGTDKLRAQFSERLMYIRPPLFLLIFSESMSLSFFPMYVESLYEPISWLPKEIVIGLPISIFMLVWALSLPFAGQWSDRAGRRRTFLVGAGITAVGLVLTGLAQDMTQLLLWRSLTAVGYGVVFITAQGYVTDHTGPNNRTKGMALFLSGFFSGSLCGAAIGGILADRIGFNATFFLSAGLSIASALFVYRFLVERRQQSGPAPAKLSARDFGALMGNKYFMAVTFLSAIPSKMALTGFLYYAGPMYLMELGASKSSTGRVLMAYGLAIIVISPIAAMIADKLGRRQVFVTLGGMLASGALLSAYLAPGLSGIVIGIALLGMAHAIGVSPQLALITELQAKHGSPVALGKTIGIFRLTERLGNISGPLIAGALITLFGFGGTFLWMGVGTMISVLSFSLLMMVFRWNDNRNQPKPEAVAA